MFELMLWNTWSIYPITKVITKSILKRDVDHDSNDNWKNDSDLYKSIYLKLFNKITYMLHALNTGRINIIGFLVILMCPVKENSL